MKKYVWIIIAIVIVGIIAALSFGGNSKEEGNTDKEVVKEEVDTEKNPSVKEGWDSKNEQNQQEPLKVEEKTDYEVEVEPEQGEEVEIIAYD
ncbi:MAG: hypothetical protein Q4C49_03220 [Bacillota bacterium]|nr:hypothetical protein [Bacillota bacterium]